MSKNLKVAFVGGPMYDYPYTKIPEFESKTGYKVEIAAKLIHPELNEHIADMYSKGEGDYDLITTHSKYSPSQKQWLTPMDKDVSENELAEFIPSTIDLMRIDGELMQLPRNIDVKLVYYRTDIFERNGFKPPKTWEELKDIAKSLNNPPDLYGFIFPGKYSGLFGHFFEFLAMAGGTLFDNALNPIFVNKAGECALGFLRDLYFVDKVCPPELTEWHYDEVAQFFRDGKVAMTTDWPGSFATYKDPVLSKVKDKFSIAIYPVGPTGKRYVYAGGFSYAIPKSCKDRDGAFKLMRFLLSEEIQYEEAKRGAISVRISVQERIRKEAEPGSMEEQRLTMLKKTVKEHMLIPPKFAKYPAVEDALWVSLRDGYTGKISVKKALENAANEIDKILKEGDVK